MFNKEQSTSTADPEKRPGQYDIDVAPAGGQPSEDAVFGNLESGPNYRGVGAFGGFVLMTKANLGLGVLALPSVFSVLGLVPGILCILAIQSIIAYCGVVIGSFKRNHPQVYGLADAGGVVFGRFGKETFYFIFVLFMVFIIGSALVGVSTSLNAITNHGTCTAVFVAVAAVVGFLLGSIRTLGKISWIGWAGIASIMAAIITLTAAVATQDHPVGVKDGEPFEKGFFITTNPTFASAISMVNGIVFSYGATPMYFGIVSEMRDQRTYARSMVASVSFLTVVYLIIGSVVYYYCGTHVTSPALGSAGVVMKRVCYGIALPGLLASLTIFSHLCGKTIFVRLLAGSPHLSSNSPTHWMFWLGSVAACVIVGYIIASAIPIFGSLISFIGALICPWVCIIPYTFMWWHDNWRYSTAGERKRRMIPYIINISLLVIGLFLCVAGTYGAIVDLINTTVDNGPWSCANNSGELQ